jgi:LPXTG-site transpeptidase (sortase) family protein
MGIIAQCNDAHLQVNFFMQTWEKWLIVFGACLTVFVFLDFGFFWANLKFTFGPRTLISVQNLPGSILPKLDANTIIIKSLGLQAPVIYATSTSDSVEQADLNNGVVHYPGTANPGQLGNCYIFGHSSNYIWIKSPYKTIFALLPDIKIGADIFVSDGAGNVYDYKVSKSYMVAANTTAVLSQGNYQKKLLTLQTSYPVGTALARWVVVAELVGQSPQN